MNDVKEKAKALFTKVKEGVKKVSKKVWIIIAAVLVVLIVAIAIMLTLNKKAYAVLVTQVSDTEAANIVSFLDERGVTDYRVEDGNTILVPEGQAATLKGAVLMANLNKTGHYYYLNNLSSFSTNEERNTIQRFDFQDDMAATIRTFENVVDAEVYITPGENRAYILDSNNVIKATASVSVTMAQGTMLSDGQAEAIQQLVANAVQGLEIESVSITDKAGNIYLTGDALSGDASALKLQLQQSFENRIRTQVLNVLTPFFGEDNVRVGVTCEVEIDRTTTQGTDIILPEYAQDGDTDGRGIRSSEAWTYYVTRPGEELPGGVVGTEVNSDLPEQVEAGATPEENDRTIGGSNQIDYENSRREYQSDNNGAVRMTDCSIAVSINARTAGDFNVDDIRYHVARAANIEGELDPVTGEEYLDGRISVVSMDFYNPSTDVGPFGPDGNGGITVQTWVLIAAGAGLLLFIILLTVILLLRRKRRKKREEEEERQRQEAEAMMRIAGLGQDGEGAETGANVMDLEMERGMELRKEIRQFAQDNPEIAAQMIKGWLRGGDDNG